MTAWTTISNTVIASGKAGTTGLFTALRDNLLAAFEGASGAPKIQTAALQDLAVTHAKIADFTIGVYKLSGDSVKQYALDTSQGEVSTTSIATITLPGGEYGFYPRIKHSSAGGDIYASIAGAPYDSSGFWVWESDDSSNAYNATTSYVTTISLARVSGTAYAQQRYIDSSPPYNIGDGDVPLFVFALIGADGAIKATYTAPVPPWAYNGPTRVTTDRVCRTTGRKFQTVRQFCRESGELTTFEREVCHGVKNADMPLIPHPFSNLKPGERVVILEPCATEKLHGIQRAGESIAELLHGDYLRLGNDISVASSPGVTPVNFKFKNSK